MAQMVECLPSKPKTLLRSTKKKKSQLVQLTVQQTLQHLLKLSASVSYDPAIPLQGNRNVHICLL
jgi:hypothetical protein